MYMWYLYIYAWTSDMHCVRNHANGSWIYMYFHFINIFPYLYFQSVWAYTEASNQ